MSILSAEGFAFDAKAPVIIIGAGAAGLVAALSACEAGQDVLVLERDSVPRGSTALSAGLIPAPGTRWQKAAGIVDSPELFGSDIGAKASGEPDPLLVKTVTKAIGPTIEWLADRYGLPFSLIEDFRYPGHSVCRMHGLPSRSGGELVDRLREAVAYAGVELLCDARVTSLFAEPDGRIAGVEVKRPDGSKELIGCVTLILACNGYGGNKDLVQRHIPELGTALYFGHEGNQGDALLWGQALGAGTRHLSGHQGHGSVAHPHGILITWATITEGGFQVNLRGERFSDESHGYSEQAAVVLRQPQGLAWTIFDERIAGIARQFEDFRQAEALGAILTAETVKDLASQMSIPVENLKATFAEVDALKHAETSDRFGRRFSGAPSLQTPYHAVKVTGALFHTQGGLVVDGDARVMRENGTALPNLFAVGGAACGVSGSKAEGYLSGNGLLSAVALGRVAGIAAARSGPMRQEHS
ncbi:fumarate reductase flavoprotein subunit [Microvirga lupini]|uniref:Fumarate reductase flavoprotein subunit n=1 Tax=Microvirga lupini TaxID=420324 RepID=A0A7W4YV27_9HYPH|nr:FAD-dependent oxidoreductase [Microvirga lupini]MBB3017436.1 fumarate reductase flavoprotein subunit [Microvirga lupini]